MKFLEQVTVQNQSFITYLKGSLVFIFFHFIGQIPLSLYLIVNSDVMDGSADPSDILGSIPSNSGLFLLLLPFVFTLPFIYWVVRKMHHQSFTSLVTAREKIDLRRICFSFFLWGVVSAAMVLLAYWISPDDYLWNFKPLPFLILVLLGVLMIPIQTSVEELVFRGYLLQGFGVLFKNRWLPLLFTSVIFGLLHLWNPEIEKLGIHLLWYYIGTGLFLGVITLMDDGMELALGFHAANNLVTALLVTASWTAFQTESLLIDQGEPSLGEELVLTLVIVYPVMALVFAKKYQWKNAIQRLTRKF